jgi:ABC-type phosphate transport system substrate-binding protein
MNRRRLLLALAPCLLGLSAAAQEADYKLIVNAANPVAQMKREQVTALFMTRGAKWAHGPAGTAVDQSMTSPVRKAFSQEVLGQPPEGVQNHWRKRMLEAREFPPAVKASDAEVIASVGKDPGGIGYVSAAAELPATVKAVKIADPIR